MENKKLAKSNNVNPQAAAAAAAAVVSAATSHKNRRCF